MKTPKLHRALIAHGLQESHTDIYSNCEDLIQYCLGDESKCSHEFLDALEETIIVANEASDMTNTHNPPALSDGNATSNVADETEANNSNDLQYGQDCSNNAANQVIDMEAIVSAANSTTNISSVQHYSCDTRSNNSAWATYNIPNNGTVQRANTGSTSYLGKRGSSMVDDVECTRQKIARVQINGQQEYSTTAYIPTNPVNITRQSHVYSSINSHLTNPSLHYAMNQYNSGNATAAPSNTAHDQYNELMYNRAIPSNGTSNVDSCALNNESFANLDGLKNSQAENDNAVCLASTSNSGPGRKRKEEVQPNSIIQRSRRDLYTEIDQSTHQYIYLALSKLNGSGVLTESYRKSVTTMTEADKLNPWNALSISYVQEENSNNLGRHRNDNGDEYQQQHHIENGPGVRLNLLNDVLLQLKTKLFEDYNDLLSQIESENATLHIHLTDRKIRRLKPRVPERFYRAEHQQHGSPDQIELEAL